MPLEVPEAWTPARQGTLRQTFHLFKLGVIPAARGTSAIRVVIVQGLRRRCGAAHCNLRVRTARMAFLAAAAGPRSTFGAPQLSCSNTVGKRSHTEGSSFVLARLSSSVVHETLHDGLETHPYANFAAGDDARLVRVRRCEAASMLRTLYGTVAGHAPEPTLRGCGDGVRRPTRDPRVP